MNPPKPSCDLLVIGCGFSGMAAALFAAQSGLRVAQVGVAGEINFASGFLDLLGVHPMSEGRWRQDPWEAIADLRRDLPGHPYARLPEPEIRAAMDRFTAFLAEGGLPYAGLPDANTPVITPAGTLKLTYRLPETMAPGALALAEGRPCLLVGFEGLKGFSSRQIHARLAPRWKELRHETAPFPGMTGELYAEHAARALEQPAMRERLLETLFPLLGDAKALGLPALLGLDQPMAVTEHLSRELGAAVFEIPTLPPSIPGIRIRRLFQNHLPRIGAQVFYQKRVLGFAPDADAGFVFHVGHQDPEIVIHARAAVLCTGRFFGRGLHADRKTIRETLFDLPVHQPQDRVQWHQDRFFAPEGHAINQAGLLTDADFRPLNISGEPAHAHLYAAGAILAHQDWVRMKCGAGLAIATAWGAIRAACRGLGAAGLSAGGERKAAHAL